MINLYFTNQAYMRTGDRLEWHSKTLLGWAIRLKTGDWSNHTGMVIRFKDFEGHGLLDKRFTTEALENGTELNRISKRLEKFDGEVMWHPLKTEYNKYREAMGAKAIELIGTPYDYNAIVRQLIAMAPTDLRRLFCSEYVFVCGRDVGLPLNKTVKYTKKGQPKSPRPGREMQELGWWGHGVRIK